MCWHGCESRCVNRKAHIQRHGARSQSKLNSLDEHQKDSWLESQWFASLALFVPSRIFTCVLLFFDSIESIFTMFLQLCILPVALACCSPGCGKIGIFVRGTCSRCAGRGSPQKGGASQHTSSHHPSDPRIS